MLEQIRRQTKFPFFLYCVVLALLLPNSTFAQASQQVEVRVRVKVSSKSLSLIGQQVQIHSEQGQLSVPGQHLRVGVQAHEGRLWWRLSFGESHHLVQAEQLKLISKVPFLGDTEGLPSHLTLVLSPKDKSFHIVGRYPMEEYLAGVVAAEMPLAWPVEALKAQLVAARSYSLSVMSQRRSRAWDVEKGVQDQAFDPTYRNKIPDIYVQKLQAAVVATKGQSLVDAKQRVVKTYYHAHCGGQTQSPLRRWGSGDDWEPAVDTHCATSPSGRWTYQITRDALQERLRRRNLHKSSEKLLSLSFTRYPGEQRVDEVELHFPTKNFQLKSHDMREALGYSELKSTRFEMKQIGDQLVFQGQGHGHGVGLCQWGAKALAESGADYKKILSHYYPNSRIRR